ncbi:MAG: S41 family peptidase [Candidatus Fermentibacteraceae bacterium]
MLFRSNMPGPEVRSGLLPPMIVIAVMTGMLASPAFSQQTSESPRAAEEDAATRIDSIGFEVFEEGIPAGMEAELGAETGEAGIENGIHRDTEVLRSGESSLRIEGTDSTTHWYALQADIPDDVGCVEARLWVKGEGLQATPGQYDNTYAGFRYRGLQGDNSYAVARIPAGTFDWTEITVYLDAEAQLADSIRFMIFSSVSGTLWVDDLTFLYGGECEATRPEALEGPLAEYIGALNRPTTFMEMAPPSRERCPDSIAAAEAREDAEMLGYILDNGYSGYHFWMGRGVDFDAVVDSIKALAKDGGMVSVEEMGRIIAEGLSGIQDGHLRMTARGRHTFLQRWCPYFADVIVEPAEEAGFDGRPVYVVVQSLARGVEPGMVYAGPEEGLFRILSREGVQQYQLGVFSREYTTQAPFSFLAAPGSEATAALMLPLHECRLTEAGRTGDEVYSTREMEGVPVVRVSSFGHRADSVLQEFVAKGEELAAEEMFVVDVTGNGGGSSNYPRDFVANLNGGVAQWRLHYAELCSPATIGAAANMPVSESMPQHLADYVEQMKGTLERLRDRPVRNWLNVTQEIPPRRMGDYEGRAVFLIDRGVASSGEALVDYTRSVPGAVLVGENTGGVGTFGEVRHYWLPNSHIKLHLPCKLFLIPGFEEGVGYTPDYWLDSSDPVGEVVEWLNNPRTYRFGLEQPAPARLHDLSFDDFADGVPLHMTAARRGSCLRCSS